MTFGDDVRQRGQNELIFRIQPAGRPPVSSVQRLVPQVKVESQMKEAHHFGVWAINDAAMTLIGVYFFYAEAKNKVTTHIFRGRGNNWHRSNHSL